MRKCEDNRLVIEFPNGACTKIDASTESTHFSGVFNNFKVMDCGYLSDRNTLWLIELKRYYDSENNKYNIPDFDKEDVLNKKISELLQKSVGTLLLLNHRFGTINAFPSGINRETKIKIVHVLEVKPEHKMYLGPINDKLKARFNKFPLKVDAFAVIGYDDVKRLLKFDE